MSSPSLPSDDIFYFPPIREHENTPDPPKCSVDGLPSDDIFYFPPIRERENTPDPPNCSVDGLPTDDIFYFPPIRERENTPDPPNCSVASHSCLHSSVTQKVAGTKRGPPPTSESEAGLPPGHSQLKAKRLGQKNILDTIDVTVQKHILESSSKPKEELDTAYDHPSKRQCRTSSSMGKNDKDWIRNELNEIKTCLREVADRLQQIAAQDMEPLGPGY